MDPADYKRNAVLRPLPQQHLQVVGCEGANQAAVAGDNRVGQLAFSFWSSRIFFSNVPFAIMRYANTFFVWPMQSDRSIAWASAGRFH